MHKSFLFTYIRGVKDMAHGAPEGAKNLVAGPHHYIPAYGAQVGMCVSGRGQITGMLVHMAQEPTVVRAADNQPTTKGGFWMWPTRSPRVWIKPQEPRDFDTPDLHETVWGLNPEDSRCRTLKINSQNCPDHLRATATSTSLECYFGSVCPLVLLPAMGVTQKTVVSSTSL